MAKNFKAFGLTVIIAVIAVFAFAYFKNNLPVEEKKPVAIYTDQIDGAFSFEYNPEYKLSVAEMGKVHFGTAWSRNGKGLGFSLVGVRIPESQEQNTNLAEASFDVGRSNDEEGVGNCTNPGNNEKPAGGKTIGGYPFVKFESSDAGAGNFYDTTSYRGLVGGDCYALEYTIHFVNIGVYAPEQGIKEFDKSKIENDFENIIESFKFIAN